MKRLLLTVTLFLFAFMASYSQEIAVKSNLLYDATTTLNLGFEFGMGEKWTFDISGNYNPWKFDEWRLKHWMVQPEFRYWFCEKFNGGFLGLHAHGGEYNVGGLGWFFSDNMKNNRYQGYFYGGGISYGYQWVLGKRWNLEATIGAGYARLKDDKYPCDDCGEKIRTKGRNYWGPTKVGLAIIYFIK